MRHEEHNSIGAEEGAFDHYLSIIIRIGDRVLADPELFKRYEELTRRLRACKLEADRSNITNQDHDTNV